MEMNKFFAILCLQLITLGAMMNMCAVIVNDGEMPILYDYYDICYISENTDNLLCEVDIHWSELVDRYPIGNFYYSIGDIFLIFFGAIFIGMMISIIIEEIKIWRKKVWNVKSMN